MPRPPRRNEPWDVHHVYAQRADHLPLFVTNADRWLYLKLLRVETERRAWRCLMFCLMGTHVHLLVEVPGANLPEGMQRLHGDYAQIFNGRHGRGGALFARRYGNTHITDDAHLWTAVRYIARNPVEAGLCARPEDHPWSSHAYVAAGAEREWLDTPRLLELLGGAGGDPRRRYEALVGDDETTRTSSLPTATTSPSRS